MTNDELPDGDRGRRGLTIKGADLTTIARALTNEQERLVEALDALLAKRTVRTEDTYFRAGVLREEIVRAGVLATRAHQALELEAAVPPRPAQSDAELIQAGFDEAVRLRCGAGR